MNDRPALAERMVAPNGDKVITAHIYSDLIQAPFEAAAEQAARTEAEGHAHNRHSMPDADWLAKISSRAGELALNAASPPKQSEIRTHDRKPLHVDRSELLSSDVEPEKMILTLSEYIEDFLKSKYGEDAEADSIIIEELEFAKNQFENTDTPDDYSNVKRHGRYISRLWELVKTPETIHKMLNDTNTGLRSRRALEKFRSEESNEDGTLKDGSKYLMIDLNNFGTTNKVEDHEHGDLMLILTAGALRGAGQRVGIERRKMFRGTTGDEFVMIVPDEETSEEFLKKAQEILSELLSTSETDDPDLHKALRGHAGIYDFEGETHIISISGATGNTLAEADSTVNDKKIEDKKRRLKEYQKTGEYPKS